LHAQILQGGRHALNFCMQLGKGVDLLGIGLGGDRNQRSLVGTVFQVAVDRVVTQIGGAADKPARKRRVAVVAHLLWRCLPVDGFGFISPKTLPVIYGAAVEICVCGHVMSLGAIETEFIIMNIQLASN
jgi:hypothetical protein